MQSLQLTKKTSFEADPNSLVLSTSKTSRATTDYRLYSFH